ncbi:MAG: Ldh family oxidoreductase, partial [Candidatus Poribacteria bacterium]|nr:Ldh family oxidoreductase [Candidatus Poribacteria bacterium]
MRIEVFGLYLIWKSVSAKIGGEFTIGEDIMQEIVVHSARLHDFARTLCDKAGLRSEDGKTIAIHQVLTDLRGVHSHGTRALPGYLNLILDGKMNAQP